MSSTYNHASSSVNPLRSRELDFDDGLGLNNYVSTTPYEHHNLSPFNHSHTLSNSASPSYTPGESEFSDYQLGDYQDIDPFIGFNYDPAVLRVDSIPQAPILGNPAYPSADLNRPLPDLPASWDENKPASATSTNYPLSPVHSNEPNTPSPRVLTHDLKNRTTISQHELTTDLHHSRFPNFNPNLSTQAGSIQLTPDNSGSSHTSAEGLEPSTLAFAPESANTMVSHWGNATQRDRSSGFVRSSEQNNSSNMTSYGAHSPKHTNEKTAQSFIVRNEDGTWRSTETGQAGLDPISRREFDEPVETLNQLEEKRRIESKNAEIEQWNDSQNNSPEDEQPGRSFLSGNQPNSRQSHMEADDSDDNIAPLDDAVSIHENRIIEGQMYYNFKEGLVSETDQEMLRNQPRLWEDAPQIPYIQDTAFQPRTANEAMMRFARQSDAMSIASRAATWGTRRRSVPSLAEAEGIMDGSFIQRLSLTKSKNDEPRPRQNSILEFISGRRNSSTKLKRARSSYNIPEDATEEPHPRQNSQPTLNVPSRVPSFSRKTPSINTAVTMVGGAISAVGSNTHARNNSVSGGGLTSPKSPHLSFPRIMRSRSKSDFSQDRHNQTALGGLLIKHGGPPVARLARDSNPGQTDAPAAAAQMMDLPDDDENEDDDEEQVEDGDMKVDSDQQAEAIVPNYDGFKAHVRRLNPEMDTRFNWLVSRIAHQQEIRYKNLLDLRVKHSQAISNRSCSAGRHCLALGGSVTLTDAKGHPRELERSAGGLQVVTDFSDNDSNPGDGALNDETFPQGVPMPPARNLPAEFECQLCFKSKKFQKPSDWTKHVHEDVQPFTCTYDKCKEPKSFKRKADWVRHENERHRHLEWWICQVDDCRHPCYRKDNFLQHLVREHKLPEPKQKTKAAIKKARLTEPAWIMLERCHHETTNRPQDEPCKFCGKSFPTWKKLTVHLAKHMEHISLPILKLVEARSVNADTIISPVEQNLTPITPGSGMPKGEFSSSPPFNMHNVSPHIPNHHYETRTFEQPTYFSTTGPASAYGMQVPMQQQVQYNQNLFTNYAVQSVAPSRGFGTMESGGLGPNDQSHLFPGMNSGYAQPKIEPQQFETINTGFTNTMSNPQYDAHQVSGYSMPQTYSTAPANPGFQATNMLGIDQAYGFDGMPVNTAQNYQQVPMSRAQGSGSSYSHSQSPQQVPYYQHP